jgi:hypothetical protein
MSKRFTLKYVLLFPLLVLLQLQTGAQLVITSTSTAFTENFNSMGSSATATVPAGFRLGTDWNTGGTTTGLAAGTTGSGALTGTSSGAYYNFADGVTASSTDRSLGILNTGSFTSPKSIILKITNNTGTTIGSLNITFDYEKYRSGSRAFDWTFFHGSTSAPSTSATAGDQSYAADANNTVINNPPTTIGKTVNLTGLSIANGADYYLRWTFTGNGGSSNGQAIGIDNFSITALPSVSSNANLSNLVLSSGTLNPAFASGTTSYTASVPNSISSITVTPTAADAGATITVNGNTVASGSASPSIALAVGSNTITTIVTAQNGTTTNTYTVTVTRAAAGTPAIVATATPAGFGNVCINTTAGPNSFTLDGSDLDNTDITVAALAGFTYSETSGGTYTSTLTFAGGTGFTGKVIYVKFTPTAVQSYDGNIVISGGGVGSYSVPVTGSGINTAPTVTTGSSSGVGGGNATLAGSITNNGCSTITAYGIEYSTTDGFANGTGTQAAASNLGGGNFSSSLSGLPANTVYYYKAYATNGSGTSYGTQQTFSTGPVPVVLSGQSGLTFTEDFSDIANWTNNFTSGVGANHFSSVGLNATGTIPDGVKITTATSSFTTGSSGGVQKGTSSIVLLATGSTDNTAADAIDFYMDFTGLNAGTVSFDWASINNSTGDRNASLRVYTSTDGVTFTELSFADVLNFTNNSLTSGSKTNIALPASFNNSATARLRFYYHNGNGGTTGSRPKISIDNLTVTAVATTPCTTPTAAPTNLVFTATGTPSVSIQGSFTAASPAPDQYIVVASTNSSLTDNPVDGQIYNIGDNVGDGFVVAKGNTTSFTATGLTPSTTYYFFVFSANAACTGGPLYLTSTVLTGSTTTTAGVPPCAAPAGQPTNLNFSAVTASSIHGTFTAATADEYLVVRSTSSSLSASPVNGQIYNSGDALGGGVVVQRSSSTAFTATNLTNTTTYYFFVFAIGSANCTNGPVYNTTSPLTGSQATTSLPSCQTPTGQPVTLTFATANTMISGAFDSGTGADSYLVVRSTSSTLSGTPVDNTSYNSGDALGGGTVVTNTSSNNFLATGLTSGTTYYFFVFAENSNCSGGAKYLAASPLSGSAATTSAVTYNYYFGTLHSHSDYSDGNQDHPGYTPADDYNYAITAQCMDYLGISEHNHFSSANNPGNTITNFHMGSIQANNFTSSHPNFLALYGMEWGVISGGGHVVVYGDGMDNLWGWESGAGGWGPTNNYDVFVAKSDYTGPNGLFKTVNDNSATNTFATLAHPNSTDFNNLSNVTYDVVADNAIVGTAVESGPATSTNQTYSNPGSSLSYLGYFQKLLSRGYHLGPTIDHDNHNTTFGHTTFSRTAIVAPALNKTEIIKAMHDMHFYATQDCDSKVDFTINTRIMGSTFTDRYAPIINVVLSDVGGTGAARIRVMYGVPGSSTTAVKIDSAIGSTLTFVDVNLQNLATGYYYIDIANGTSRIITAPIWYTRQDNNSVVLPVKLVSFDAVKQNDAVKLSWSTSNEVNARSFQVERSTDGRNFQVIGTVAAAGTTSTTVNYGLTDQSPNSGNNYYRLRVVDVDSRSSLSKVIRIDFSRPYTVTLTPNPAHSDFTITVTNTTQPLVLQVVDMNGKVVKSQSIRGQVNKIPVSDLSKGLYLLKVNGLNTSYTEKLVIE